jgi:hypothetical protein
MAERSLVAQVALAHAHVTSRRRSVVGRWWAAQPWQAGLLCGGEANPLSVAETGAHVERSRWQAREMWVALGGSLVTFGFRPVELRA